MKHLLLICLLVLCCAVYAQSDSTRHTDAIPHSLLAARPAPAAGEHLFATPGMPYSILRRHRVGLGLTIAGSAMVATGLTLMIADAGDIGTVTGPGYSNVVLRGPAAAGAIIGAVGVPLLIVGIVKLVKSKHQALRYIARSSKPQAPSHTTY